VASVTDEHDTRLSPEDEIEVVDGLPVVANHTRVLESHEPAPLPARQAAALAATGFAAGAVTAAVVTRRRARRRRAWWGRSSRATPSWSTSTCCAAIEPVALG
jgi:hypothetical protein